MDIIKNDIVKYIAFIFLFSILMACYQIGKRDGKLDGQKSAVHNTKR